MSKRLSELQRKHALKVAEVKALIEKSDEDVVSDEDKSAFEAIKGELATLKESIELLKAVRELEAEEAEPVEDEEEKRFAPTRKSFNIGTSVQKVAKGTRAARFAIAAHIAKKSGSLNAGVRFAQDAFGDALVAKALSTTTQIDGGALIPQEFVAELVDLLRAKSVVRRLGARSVPMPMGNMTYPRLQTASTAQWQDEVSSITASQPLFDNIYLSAKKLTAFVQTSNDLIRRSPLAVESIIRDDMVKQVALAEDKAFLLGTGSNNQPSGIFALTNSANIIADTTTGPTLATVNNVLFSLENKLLSNNVDTDSATWIFHSNVFSFLSTLMDSTGRYFFRDDLQAGVLLGRPFAISNQIDTNLNTNLDTRIFFVNMDQLIIADTLSMQVDSSDVAGSAFQTDHTYFRCINEVDFNMQHGFSAAVATVRNWKPTGASVAAGAAYVTETAVTTGTAAKSAKP